MELGNRDLEPLKSQLELTNKRICIAHFVFATCVTFCALDPTNGNSSIHCVPQTRPCREGIHDWVCGEALLKLNRIQLRRNRTRDQPRKARVETENWRPEYGGRDPNCLGVEEQKDEQITRRDLDLRGSEYLRACKFGQDEAFLSSACNDFFFLFLLASENKNKWKNQYS